MRLRVCAVEENVFNVAHKEKLIEKALKDLFKTNKNIDYVVFQPDCEIDKLVSNIMPALKEENPNISLKFCLWYDNTTQELWKKNPPIPKEKFDQAMDVSASAGREALSLQEYVLDSADILFAYYYDNIPSNLEFAIEKERESQRLRNKKRIKLKKIYDIRTKSKLSQLIQYLPAEERNFTSQISSGKFDYNFKNEYGKTSDNKIISRDAMENLIASTQSYLKILLSGNNLRQENADECKTITYAQSEYFTSTPLEKEIKRRLREIVDKEDDVEVLLHTEIPESSLQYLLEEAASLKATRPDKKISVVMGLDPLAPKGEQDLFKLTGKVDAFEVQPYSYISSARTLKWAIWQSQYVISYYYDNIPDSLVNTLLNAKKVHEDMIILPIFQEDTYGYIESYYTKLNKRELQLVRDICKGMTYSAASEEYGMSSSNIKSVLAQLIKKISQPYETKEVFTNTKDVESQIKAYLRLNNNKISPLLNQYIYKYFVVFGKCQLENFDLQHFYSYVTDKSTLPFEFIDLYELKRHVLEILSKGFGLNVDDWHEDNEYDHMRSLCSINEPYFTKDKWDKLIESEKEKLRPKKKDDPPNLSALKTCYAWTEFWYNKAKPREDVDIRIDFLDSPMTSSLLSSDEEIESLLKKFDESKWNEYYKVRRIYYSGLLYRLSKGNFDALDNYDETFQQYLYHEARRLYKDMPVWEEDIIPENEEKRILNDGIEQEESGNKRSVNIYKDELGKLDLVDFGVYTILKTLADNDSWIVQISLTDLSAATNMSLTDLKMRLNSLQEKRVLYKKSPVVDEAGVEMQVYRIDPYPEHWVV